MDGRVVAAHGRQYVVELPDGSLLPCFTRGKKSDVAVGDGVDVQLQNQAEGVIQAVKEVDVKVPIIIRLEGTNVEEGRRLLDDSGLTFTVAADMQDAARKVAALVD